jgi:hypothetical protein
MGADISVDRFCILYFPSLSMYLSPSSPCLCVLLEASFVDELNRSKSSSAEPSCPYSDNDLAATVLTCTSKEDAVRKVEREMSKRIAAVAQLFLDGLSQTLSLIQLANQN